MLDGKSQLGIVYGPIESRRFGRSLGINLLGDGPKVCGFNCPYCNLGPTSLRLNKIKSDIQFPQLSTVDEAVRAAFQRIHANGPIIDGICISGNGEPTLHPDFPDIIKQIKQYRDTFLPGKPLSVLTNGSLLDQRKIADALNSVDERIVKIDAGNEKVFKTINAPLSRATLARVIMGARNLKDLIVQSMFVKGSVTNIGPTDIDDWIEVIAIINPKAVHIHGMNQAPAIDGVVACDEDTLYTIASRLERKTKIKALVVM